MAPLPRDVKACRTSALLGRCTPTPQGPLRQRIRATWITMSGHEYGCRPRSRVVGAGGRSGVQRRTCRAGRANHFRGERRPPRESPSDLEAGSKMGTHWSVASGIDPVLRCATVRPGLVRWVGRADDHFPSHAHGLFAVKTGHLWHPCRPVTVVEATLPAGPDALNPHPKPLGTDVGDPTSGLWLSKRWDRASTTSSTPKPSMLLRPYCRQWTSLRTSTQVKEPFSGGGPCDCPRPVGWPGSVEALK